MRRGGTRGFTLVELLVAVGLIALLAGVIGFALRGGDRSQGRDAAVSTLVSLLSQTRGLAAVRGVNAALLVNADINNAERYLRYAIVTVWDDATASWKPVDGGVTLPQGLYFLPNANPLPTAGTGIIKSTTETWTRGSGGGDVRSTALSLNYSGAIGSAISESWIGVEMTPVGTLRSSAGDIAIASGRPLSGGVPVGVQLEAPDSVVGVSLSVYAAATVLRFREDF